MRIDTESEHIHRHRDDIDVARAFPVAEQRSLDAIRTRQEAHLRIRYAAAAIVVRVERENDAVTVFQPLVDIGNLHAIDVRHRHLYRRGKIDDRLAVGGRLPHIEHGIADLERILRLRARKALGRVFKAILRPRLIGQLFEEICTVHGDFQDLLLGARKDLLALCRRGGIVDVHDGVLHTTQCIERLADDMFTRLCQNLHGYIIGDEVVLHQTAQELILRIRCRRKADFDLLEPDAHEEIKEGKLLIEAHRNDECLIAIAQIDRAPERCMIGCILFQPVHADLRRHKVALRIFLIIHHDDSPASMYFVSAAAR